MAWLEQLGNSIWNPWLLGGFLLLGLYLSVRSGWFQLFGIRTWLSRTLGSLGSPKKQGRREGISQVQALSTALASTIGTGSIAGVATAIFYGGMGAVFWMWLSAILGMMTACVEKTLSVAYRRRRPGGGWLGGPMYYMEDGLGLRPLGLIFSLFCLLASLAGGNMVQSNSIATALHHAFGWDTVAVGLVTGVVTGLVIFGGIGRIGQVCERLVPVMALVFLGGGLVVLYHHRVAIPSVLEEIVTQAFAPKAVVGGGLGYGLATALRYGVARGVFTNEAGLGSSAMAHAAAQVEHPAEEGLWGILEVCIATLVVCTVTALVIGTSGVYQASDALQAIAEGQVTSDMVGAALSGQAFASVMGKWGSWFVALCLLMFAFSSLLGWSYYGSQSLAYLTGSQRWNSLYHLLFLLCIYLGSQVEVGTVWQLADVCNGLMALPNLVALFLLAPEGLQLLKGFLGRKY